MTPPPPLFHALLRPAILQILRATGYHSAKTSVIDSITDLAARYFLHLCHLTALYASHNNDELSLPSLPPPPSHLPITEGAGEGEGELGEEPGPATATTPAPPTTTTTTAAATASASAASASTASAVAYASAINPAIPAPTIVDVRMALQRAGALLPERILEEQEYLGEEDTRGVEGFIAWAMGGLNREITRIALDGNDEAGDYLDGEFSFRSYFLL